MTIQWSGVNRLFWVTIPEFSDRVVMLFKHGKTRDEAIRNGEEVICTCTLDKVTTVSQFLNPKPFKLLDDRPNPPPTNQRDR